jgi:GAF domain-containing protein
VTAVSFAAAYGAALRRHLSDPDEETLHAAYELGRDAVRADLGVVELVTAHHDVLRHTLDDADVDAALDRAGSFLREAASAYEMVSRGFREAQDAALAERRHAAMIRRLSSFLADASLLTGGDALDEVLTLLVEHARELTNARCCSASCSLTVGGAATEARSTADEGCTALLDALPTEHAAALSVATGLGGRVAPEEAAEHAVLGRLAAAAGSPVAWLGVPILALDGRPLGFIHVLGEPTVTFGETDEAVIVHLAEMVGATIERMRLYGAGDGSSPER